MKGPTKNRGTQNEKHIRDQLLHCIGQNHQRKPESDTFHGDMKYVEEDVTDTNEHPPSTDEEKEGRRKPFHPACSILQN